MPTVPDAYRAAHAFTQGKIYALEDETVNLLFEQYMTAYNRMRAQMSDIWHAQVGSDTWGDTDIAARDAILAQIRAEMDALQDVNLTAMLDGIEDGIRAGYYGEGYTLDNSVFMATDIPGRLPLLPAQAIRAQATAPYLGATWIERYQGHRVQFELDIKNSLIQSQIDGEGMAAAQRRLRDTLGVVTDRRLAANRKAHRRNFNRTQMIVRTEIIRASNTGALAVYEANRDVLRGWEWLTAKDDRVCPICGPLDGETFSFSGRPLNGGKESPHGQPPAHPMCRCTVIPVLIDQALQDAIVGPRQTFTQWAAEQGLTQDQYGNAYDLRGKDAPRLKAETA